MFHRRTIQKRLATIAVVTTVTAFGCSHAFAAAGPLCIAYINEALKAAKQIRTDGCLFDTTDPRWSLNKSGHSRWCFAVSDKSVEEERKTRSIMVNICLQCREYARNAISAVEAASKNGCAVSGGARWSDNEDDHYKWCAGLNHYVPRGTVILSSAPSAETSARAQELGQCVAQTDSPLKLAAPEVGQPLSSSRSNTARTVPEQTGSRRLGASSPELQSAKKKSKVGKPLRSRQTGVTRSAPCIGGHGHPCAGDRGVLRPGLLGSGGDGISVQGPSAAGRASPSVFRPSDSGLR